MATANMANSPITQVQQTPVQTNLQPQLLTRLLLDLRGKRFSVDRETIMNLPESVLLCLFPNGLVLSRQSAALSDGGDNDDYEELYAVDVRPTALSSMFHAYHVLTALASSTQTASLTCLRFSRMRLTPFTGRRIHQVSSPHSSTSSKADHPRPTSVPPPRTLYCQSRLLSSSVRNLNTFRYLRRMARPRRTATA